VQRALKDTLAGLTFVAFGLIFAIGATTYEIGSTLEMGPGYFPLVLGGLLVLLGGTIVAKGFLEGEGEEIGSVPWRALGLVIGAVAFFALTVRGLGLVPATCVAALMSAFASQKTGVVSALAIALGLTVICVVIFVMALSLRLPLVGPWLPF
jgi:hypothetical protein